MVAGVCRRRLSSSVTLHVGPAGGFTCTGQAMTSCCLQSNHISIITLYGGPVVLRPVRATLCLFCQIVLSFFSGSLSLYPFDMSIIFSLLGVFFADEFSLCDGGTEMILTLNRKCGHCVYKFKCLRHWH